MMGISGMRGVVGSTFTPAVVTRHISALAAVLGELEQPGNGTHFRVVLGRDTRPSGAWVRDCVAGALIASGVEVIDLDIVTTPGTAIMVRHLGADAAVIVTASHNPIQWNGLKVLNGAGMALPAAVGAQIGEAFQQSKSRYVAVEKLIAPQRNTQTHAVHVARVLDYVDVLGISSKRFKVVLDSVNGAGCIVTPTLLSKLGCQVVHINATPNGLFPHVPEPTKQNLTGLCEEVIRQKAQIGFAQDPDADRLAMVDENGVYIGEEYTQILGARFILAKRPGGLAVTNLSSSRMLEDVAARYGAKVIRTPVGEANVVGGMMANQATIGGEGNGGVIDLRIVPTRDSLVGMAYTLGLMAETGKTLSQLVAEIPKYETVKTKFECRREDANRAVEAVNKQFASDPDVKINRQDGIRIEWPDAWLHARPSNTEPIMRISAEAPTKAAAEKRVADVRAVVDQTLGKK